MSSPHLQGGTEGRISLPLCDQVLTRQKSFVKPWVETIDACVIHHSTLIYRHRKKQVGEIAFGDTGKAQV